MTPKLIAFYFPQFHAIPENDEWWGKGFTDWDLVKKAKSLYAGHVQPRVPSDGVYYNPCEYETLRKQINLAKEYGVSGFMLYHYWFDGKLLLEKPLETYLNNKDLDMPFCICWANESWGRGWVGHPEELLMEQTHTPDKNIWSRHYEYLRPFFMDERAIKIDGKVVVVIYQPMLINKAKEMFDFWRDKAKEDGIELYIIGIKNHNKNSKDTYIPYDGILKFQPREAYTSPEMSEENWLNRFDFLRHMPEFVLNRLRKLYMKVNSYSVYNSEKVWDIILKYAYKKEFDRDDLDVFESGFFEWDNSSRYGRSARIFTRPSDEKLVDYMTSLKNKAEEASSPYVFFNAWNEWSESAYLEPDKEYGYRSLEIIKKVFK